MQTSRFPHALVLIFAMIILAQLLTYVLPAGEYDLDVVDGKARAVPGSYHAVEAEPLPWYAFIAKPFEGLTHEETAPIIFFVFLVGGVISVVRATGAIDALIGTTLRRVGGRPTLLVAGMLTLFALGSSTIGMAEEYVPFIPILVSMCLALKMDAIVAMGLVYLGAGIGYGCAAYNPFTVLIAQGIADLEPTSGDWYRWILLVVMLAIGVQHILAYARRIQRDPTRSLVADVDYSEGFEVPKDTRMTGPRLAILLAFAAGIAFFVWGVAQHGWYFHELSAVFLSLGLLAAVIGRLSPNRTAAAFVDGAAEMTSAALLIGFARTIEVVLNDGKVIHTVIHGLAETLPQDVPAISACAMLGVQSFFNFLIPSGSGQAYVTMPIMAPLADIVGVSRQTAVLAYQFGDGLTNMIVPTNALLMGMLALGRIPFHRWARFALGFLLKAYVVCVLALILAVQFGYA